MTANFSSQVNATVFLGDVPSGTHIIVFESIYLYLFQSKKFYQNVRSPQRTRYMSDLTC